MSTLLTRENEPYVVKEWEHVSCPICKTDRFKSHEKFGPDHRYTYVQCLNCRLVYANPRPKYDADFVATAYEVYDTESHHVVTKGQLNALERAVIERHKIRLRQMEEFLGRKGNLLEIGCATGLFLYAAREEGWRVTGIDVSATMTRFAEQAFGMKTYCGQYHELDLSRERDRFDVIYCSHVLEHIPNPNDWVEKFKRDLKPTGIVCLNVPNQFSVDRVAKRLLKKVGLKRDRWALWRTPDHLYEPHFKPMQTLLEKHGFLIFKYFTYSSREKPKSTPWDRLFHYRLRIGSKLRIFARNGI